MRYRRNARLDPSQIEDRRGGGGFGGLPGGGIAVGGGGLGLAGLVIYLLLSALTGGGGLSGPLGNLDGSTVAQAPPGQVLGEECQTGAQANRREDCRIVADVNSVQDYWQKLFDSNGRTYTISKTVFFTGSTDTGCGAASTDVGPIYCPLDKHDYIDLGFFDELRTRFGARGGPFAQAYVLAHEYGHHVQDLLGILGQGSSQQGAEGRSVRTSCKQTASPASGRTTPRRPATSPTSRRRTSATCSTPRPPSATTGSSRRHKDRSTPRRGRTAPPRSASTGSAAATRTASPQRATRSADVSDLYPQLPRFPQPVALEDGKSYG